jgi:predicted HAD superfamily Cof-like phosphohydrolase
MKMVEQIEEFHAKFGLSQPGDPRLLDEAMAKFRIVCLKEEIAEFEEAIEKGDLPGAFDALIDLAYFTLGTAHVMNLPWEAGWERVHAANMAKIRTERPADSKRGSGFDVVKPAGWSAPILDDLVRS